MKKYYPIAILLFVIILVTAYRAPKDGDKPYVNGEILVKIKPGLVENQESVISSLVTEFSFIRLEYQANLSHRLGIHLYKFTPDILPDEDVLKEFRKHPLIELAQFNHYTEMRETIPTDQYFDQQWNMMNTGQNGGTVDADIDATDAWDIATGEVTALGDTIVIAVADDGFDLDHEDLIFWVNIHEIDNNGIDDDTNGYVDDYLGWNSVTHSGNITDADHGTHVTGIASAQGNNDRGVAGVNWDTKVMAVQKGPGAQESIVVEAYGYIYEMRKRYNETNGARGAFVVVANSSFGINNGQPEDYPIWGAMYDSMGAEGILNAAATANANVDVDVVGDIPTAFANEHLISVTNTDKDDVKAFSAGYGLTTIDLGAPGTGIFSTRVNNIYGTKTGTSMASPHVAGAVALIYAAAPVELLEAYHNDPAGIALVIKQHILNGVDPKPSLAGKCVSGGRLNVFNSIQLMLDPMMSVDPLSVYKEVSQDETETVEVAITNNTTSSFNYYLTYDPTVTWLSLSQSSGIIAAGGQDSFEIYMDAEGLDTALYFTYVHIDYNNDYQYMLPVNMDVIKSVGISERENRQGDVQLNAYPNPFTDQVSVKFTLAEQENIQLSIQDLSGKKIKQVLDGTWPAGDHVVIWDGTDDSGAEVPAGVYLLNLKEKEQTTTVKVLKSR